MDKHEETDLILRNGIGDDFHFPGPAHPSDETPEALCRLSVKDLFPVSGNPHQAALEVIYGVRSYPVTLHALRCLKPSPRGEGLTPRRNTKIAIR